MMTSSLIIAIVVVFVALFAVTVARQTQKWADGQRKGEKKSAEPYSWVGQIHGIWWWLGAGLGGLKYIWKAWKTAPDGSAAKFGWSAVLALIAAIGLFALAKLLDNKLNPPKNENEIEEQRNRLPTTFTRAPVTEKWEYKR